ncbi:Uncharacterised protein [Vibrio cholerae]|nr:Uncharacterised protein [Vibrio cholerae]
MTLAFKRATSASKGIGSIRNRTSPCVSGWFGFTGTSTTRPRTPDTIGVVE